MTQKTMIVSRILLQKGVDISEVNKNGFVKHGACLKKEGICPVVYLEDYKEDPREAEEIANEIYTVISMTKPNFTIEEVIAFDPARLRVRLLHQNESFLADKVWSPLEDLAIVLTYEIQERYSTYVTKEMVKMWRKEGYEDVLLLFGLKNMEEAHHVVFRSLSDQMAAMGEYAPETPGLYVCTTDDFTYGAVAALYADSEFKKFANMLKAERLVIIPSSVHEVLVFPEALLPDLGYLTAMIQEVNFQEVSPEEVLSDHPYIYDVRAGKIISA